MGYDYEIGQRVYLLEKNPLGTSCQLLLINRNNSSHGWATVIRFGELQKL